jgi:hypothetical protein
MSVNVQNYIQDKHPYKKKVYASFDETLKVAEQTLEEFGWKLLEKTDPQVFERYTEFDTGSGAQSLLFVQLKGGAKFNVFIRQADKGAVDVEVRFLKASSLFFKKFYQYHNDKLANRYLKRLEERLD